MYYGLSFMYFVLWVIDYGFCMLYDVLFMIMIFFYIVDYVLCNVYYILCIMCFELLPPSLFLLTFIWAFIMAKRGNETNIFPLICIPNMMGTFCSFTRRPFVEVASATVSRWMVGVGLLMGGWMNIETQDQNEVEKGRRTCWYGRKGGGRRC